jgi:type I restriction enzyme S subunit
MQTLGPYPSYKPSGVPWLGDVPNGWQMRSFGSLAVPRNERNRTDLPLLSVLREKGVVLRSSLAEEENHNFIPDDLSNYRVVRKGDLAINKMKAWQGSLGISLYDGLVSPAYYVYAFDASNLQYAHRLLRSRPYIAFYNQASDGVRIGQWDLSKDRLRRIPVLLPPPDDQSAVVRYLEYMDRRIRKYILVKQKLIKLLEEQKQAIIRKAVTRGIDPNVKLKPSGVPWLGDVPEHWDVRRLKWVTRLQRGYDLPADRRVPGPFPVVSSGGFIDTHSESKCLGPGVVMGRYGSTDAVFYVEQDFWPHNTALFVTHFQGNMPRWCYYLLRTITKADHAGKSAVPGVDRKDLFQIVVAVPPIEEQVEIVRSIEMGSLGLNNAISTAQREIALLREYRTRLVADVVTGKLDVREAAAGLPEEAGETESHDVIEADVDDIEDSVGEAEKGDGEAGS